MKPPREGRRTRKPSQRNINEIPLSVKVKIENLDPLSIVKKEPKQELQKERLIKVKLEPVEPSQEEFQVKSEKRKRKRQVVEVKTEPKEAAAVPQRKKKKVSDARATVKVKKKNPINTYKVAGVTFRSDNVNKAIKKNGEVWPAESHANSHTVILEKEPTNKYDRHAIKVNISGYHCGYIPKEENRSIDLKATYKVRGLRYIPHIGAHAALIVQIPKVEKMED